MSCAKSEISYSARKLVIEKDYAHALHQWKADL